MKDTVKIIGKHLFIFRDVETNIVLRSTQYSNAITLLGLNMLAKRIAQTGNDCNITYGAVGTGAFPASPSASTTLVTELARKLVTTISASGSVASIRTFFGASAANGTLKEFGLFGEAATAAADSGTMFNHAQITEVKSPSETLTIESTITFS